MPRKKTAAGQQDSSRVAQPPKTRKNLPFYKGELPFYYEYITPDGVVVLLDHYEWARGLGITDKEVKKAQAARKREVAKGYADTKEA
jgi:hypothetical protein